MGGLVAVIAGFLVIETGLFESLVALGVRERPMVGVVVREGGPVAREVPSLSAGTFGVGCRGQPGQHCFERVQKRVGTR